MVAERKVIPVEPDSELGRLLDEAVDAEIVLEREGERFLLIHDSEDPFATYDPTRVQEALDASVGVLKGLDVESFLEELRQQRGQARRSRRS
jgi:hypothetical protein